ncbi:MAG TPA: YdcF family protein [Gemmatimonadales bacterium]|nr:YdcF family protein [Gemmatimonadales bacterium]
MRRLPRRVAKLLGLLLVVAVITYTISLVVVLVTSLQDQREPVDAIVVLGAAQYNGRPSPVLRARLEHALSLYRDQLAPRIMVTGGVGRGDTTSEAEVSRRWLLAHRLPDTAVVALPRGRSSAVSMTDAAAWLRERGLSRVLLVSDPFHMARLRFEARRTELDALVSPTPSSPISDNPNLELRYLFWEGLKAPVAWVRSWSWLRDRDVF